MPQKAPTFTELLMSAEHAAVHLEMRDSYAVADEAEDFERWKATGERDCDPTSEYWTPWVDLIRRTVSRGVSVRRARIVSEPVSEYVSWLHAGTWINIHAGEQVRWLPRARTSSLALPGNDFWLFDQTAVLFNIFDGRGDWVDTEYRTDRGAVDLAHTAFGSVWELATPHEKFAV
ncbi:DUF6879 family protein [Streptacidiphilus anmyonensis]|uniref:DUF6879 family protein n=1 Tax=Streptacidiphilus anmyonensis TaxID=405782 RepID=UPI0005AA2A29|nr:DUF6879 family protein [Streptacidiphilus anmyonensis]